MRGEIGNILLAMMEEHEHRRWLARNSKNPGFRRRYNTFQAYPCVPKSLPGLLCHHHPHPAPRGYQESDPWPVRTGREDHSATSPPRVVRLRGGPAGSTGYSLGLVSDPTRIDGRRRWRQSIFSQRGDNRRSLNTLDFIRRGGRNAPSVTAYLISGPRETILTTDSAQEGEDNRSLKVDYLCRRRAARRSHDRSR